MRYKSILTIALLFFIFSSCAVEQEEKISEFINFGNIGMLNQNEYVYENLLSKSLPDSTYQANINLIIRYSDQCNISYLPLEVEYLSIKDDSVESFTLEVQLFDKSGKNNGKGGYGIYEAEIPMLKNIIIDKNFFVSLKTHAQNIEGIFSAGIAITDYHPI